MQGETQSLHDGAAQGKTQSQAPFSALLKIASLLANGLCSAGLDPVASVGLLAAGRDLVYYKRILSSPS